DGQWLCSAGTIDNYAALIKLPDFSPASTKIIPVGQEPAYAVNSPDGQYCFVSSRGPQANSVAVLSYAPPTVAHTIATGLPHQARHRQLLPRGRAGHHARARTAADHARALAEGRAPGDRALDAREGRR